MSPTETAFVTLDLLTQKFSNPEYQVKPEEWEQASLARRAKASREVSGSVPFTSSAKLIKSAPLMLPADISDESSASVLEIHAFLDTLGIQR